MNQELAKIVERCDESTKGPWIYAGHNGYVNQGSVQPTICTVYGADPELAANGNLIAAAPDLLRIALKLDADNQRLTEAIENALDQFGGGEDIAAQILHEALAAQEEHHE